MKIRVIDYGGGMPERQHYNDAGADVRALKDAYIPGCGTKALPLGIGLRVPDGYAAYVMPRSGLASKGFFCQIPPIDSGYTGEIHAIVTNANQTERLVKAGDRIGQLVVMPIAVCDFIRDDEETNERGAGGLGSTGVA